MITSCPLFLLQCGWGSFALFDTCFCEIFSSTFSSWQKIDNYTNCFVYSTYYTCVVTVNTTSLRETSYSACAWARYRISGIFLFVFTTHPPPLRTCYVWSDLICIACFVFERCCLDLWSMLAVWGAPFRDRYIHVGTLLAKKSTATMFNSYAMSTEILRPRSIKSL